MPYPKGHREQVRRRIVESARQLFNRKGFAGVSVNSIMADAGLTRGAFYAYFESKSDLYAEVLGCFFTDPNWKSRWEGVDVDVASPDAGPQIVRATYRANILTMWRIHVPWWRYPAMLPVAIKRSRRPLRRCSKQW